MCIFKSLNKGSFSQNKEGCAQHGGIVLPLKTKGLFEFIQHHAYMVNSSHFYIGMNRTNGITSYTDLSEYSSQSYNFNGIDLTKENLQCVYLNSSNGFSPMQTECEPEFESYCLWRSKYWILTEAKSYKSRVLAVWTFFCAKFALFHVKKMCTTLSHNFCMKWNNFCAIFHIVPHQTQQDMRKFA